MPVEMLQETFDFILNRTGFYHYGLMAVLEGRVAGFNNGW